MMNNPFNPNFYANLDSDSAMIQAAVDAAAKTGDAVTIPRYNARTDSRVWNITEAILLPDHATIYLDNCHLRQADGVNTCIFRNSYSELLKGCFRNGRQHHISIIGRGNCLLDGGNSTGVTEETCEAQGMKALWDNSMINFINVEKVNILNLNIKNQRYGAMVFHYCADVQIRQIDFQSPACENGINLHTACFQFLIENISGVVGGDVILLANVKNYREKIMRDGRYDDSIHNIMIRNIHCTTGKSFVRTINQGGRKIYNVSMQNLMIDCESDPTDARPAIGMTAADYNPIHPEIYALQQACAVSIGGENDDDTPAKLGDTHGITIQNLTCKAPVGVKLSCTARDVLIENVRMYAGGGTAVCVAPGAMKNIQIRDVYFAGPISQDACAIYFENADAENVLVHNLHASEHHTAVFGGSGKADVKVTSLHKKETIPTNGAVGDIQVVEG